MKKLFWFIYVTAAHIYRHISGILGHHKKLGASAFMFTMVYGHRGHFRTEEIVTNPYGSFAGIV